MKSNEILRSQKGGKHQHASIMGIFCFFPSKKKMREKKMVGGMTLSTNKRSCGKKGQYRKPDKEKKKHQKATAVCHPRLQN